MEGRPQIEQRQQRKRKRGFREVKAQVEINSLYFVPGKKTRYNSVWALYLEAQIPRKFRVGIGLV